MPIYEYECTRCGHRTELLQRMGDPPLAACPECEGPVRKLFSAPAVQFKGSGWYVTDYAGKGKSPAAAAATTSDKSGSDSDGAGKSADKTSADKGSAASGGADKSAAAKSPKPAAGGD